MTMYFTSDTHFGDERVRQLSRRPFRSPFEMDKTMIDTWNRLVTPEDTVFHLGDFGDYSVRPALNGRIRLLPGNYERKDMAEGRVTIAQLNGLYGFDDVIEGELCVLPVPEHSIALGLVHEPSHRALYRGFCLFGHIHRTQLVKRNALNVGVDCHNYAPVDMETVLFYKNAVERHYDEEVFGL